MAWTYEATKAGYGNLWRSIKIKSSDAAATSRFARLIIANEQRYRIVQARTGVPWYFIGALHMRESSCDFRGVLHNGEKIIGKGKKTRLVPANRGPFNSWEQAAEDALKLKGLHKIRDWGAERMGFHGELFNGLGYVGKGTNSPYLWAGSNHEQSGKYVADHVWDKNADDKQIGVMTVLKRLCELRPDISKEMSTRFVPPPPDVPRAGPEKDEQPWYKKGFIGWIIGILGGGFAGTSFTVTDHLIYAVCTLIGVAMLSLAVWVYAFPPRGSFKVKMPWDG